MTTRDEARALLGELAGAHAQTFAPRPAQQVITITGVKATNAGGQETYTGLIDGEAEVVVTGGGVALGRGDVILGSRTDGSPLGSEYAYVRVLASDNPAAGYMQVDANIPYPEFDAPPTNSLLKVSGGAITASLTVFLVPISELYRPSRYVVSWRLTGTVEWRDEHLPHIVGATSLPCQLSVALLPGQSVDVKLRSEVNYAQLSSPEGPTQTYAAVTDTNSPAALSAFTVSPDTVGQLVITPTATIDPNYFLDWEYSFATSATGTGHYEVTARGPYAYVGTPDVNVWIAVRARARNFSYGNRLPSSPTAWAGPYQYQAAEQLDTTPPPDWAQPTLVATNVQSDIGGERPQLQVTFPSYSYPADYDHTIVRLVNGTSYDEWVIPYRGVAHDPIIRPLTGYGTWHVTLQGEDKNKNRSTPSADKTVALSPSGAAAAAGDATTSSVSLGVKVAFTRPANATIVKIWRATSALGAGAAVIGQSDSDYFLDLLGGVGIALSQYWYKIQGTNLAGDGAISPNWIPGTVGAYDGSNIALASMDLNVLKAATALISIIRTAATGTRWEEEGHTGSGTQDQIRFIEAISGVDKLRIMMDGTGFFVYNDAAAQEGKFYRDSTAHARFSLGIDSTYGTPALDVRWDTTKWVSEVDLYRAFMRFKMLSETLELKENNGLAGYTDRPVFYDPTIGSGKPVVQFSSNGGGVLSVFGDGLEAFSGSTAYELKVVSGRWRLAELLATAGLHAGGIPSYVAAWLATVYQATALGNTAANAQPLAAWQFNTVNTATLRMEAFRGATIGTADWQEARFRLLADVDDHAADGGGLDLGFKGYSPYFSLHTGGTARVRWDDSATKVVIDNGLQVVGALAKGSGSFVIPDPTPGHERDELRHCFVEAPTRGENLYTYVARFGPRGGGLAVEDPEGLPVAGATIADRGAAAAPARFVVAIPLPDYWPHLNERPRCLPVNSGDGWGRVRARVDDARTTLTIEAEEGGEYTVLLIGTRADPVARAWWDRRGVRKTQAQQWTNESTLARRAERLAQRARRGTTAPPPPGDLANDAPDVGTIIAAMRAAREEV